MRGYGNSYFDYDGGLKKEFQMWEVKTKTGEWVATFAHKDEAKLFKGWSTRAWDGTLEEMVKVTEEKPEEPKNDEGV